MSRKKDTSEKSPVEATEFSGLQVDTRPKPPSKTSPPGHWKDEKAGQWDFGLDQGPQPPFSPDTWYPWSPQGTAKTWTAAYGASTLSPTTPGIAKAINSPVAPNSRDKRICGLKRKRFWLVFWALIFLAIFVAALVGSLVGTLGRRRDKLPGADVKGNDTIPSVFPGAQKADVMIGSPLCVASYDLAQKDQKDPSRRQEFRMYYQSLYGNIKEAIASGSSSWQSARPILTDALNNTGLATLTYLNGSQQQGSIFYVGMNGLLQEKRKIYSDNNYWEPGTLNSLNIPMSGNMSANVSNDDPVNEWDSYRFAAVYSANFSGGPGARLFYHAQAINGSSFVQELIWLQKNDSWIQGAAIQGANPNSHLTATIDDSEGVLRLFYSAGNRSLQEVWTSTTRRGAKYSKTVRVDNLLPANNADLAAISSNGTAHLFHYASVATTSQVGIHELVITGPSSGEAKPESFNLTEPLVSSPLLPGGNNASLYQPLATSLTAVANLSPRILVFWADKPTGDPQTNATGYQSLSQVSRPADVVNWSSNTQISIPLGTEDSDPH